MIKKIFLSFALILLACRASYAEDSRSVPAFVAGYVESLETVKPALLDVYELLNTYDIWSMKKDPSYALLPSDVPILQDRLRDFNENLEFAALKMEPYLTSDDESIRTTAGRIKDNYKRLVEDNKTSESELGEFMKNAGGSDEDLKNIEREVEDRIGSFNSSLYHASEGVVGAIRKTYPFGDPTNTFPESERADILSRLKILFGEGASVTLTEGGHFRNAVWPLYETLGEKESGEPQQEPEPKQGKEITVIGGK